MLEGVVKEACLCCSRVLGKDGVVFTNLLVVFRCRLQMASSALRFVVPSFSVTVCSTLSDNHKHKKQNTQQGMIAAEFQATLDGESGELETTLVFWDFTPWLLSSGDVINVAPGDRFKVGNEAWIWHGFQCLAGSGDSRTTVCPSKTSTYHSFDLSYRHRILKGCETFWNRDGKLNELPFSQGLQEFGVRNSYRTSLSAGRRR